MSFDKGESHTCILINFIVLGIFSRSKKILFLEMKIFKAMTLINVTISRELKH